jgi:hypothetical protein
LRQERELLFLGKFGADSIDLPIELTGELPCLDALEPKFPPTCSRPSSLVSRRFSSNITNILKSIDNQL